MTSSGFSISRPEVTSSMRSAVTITVLASAAPPSRQLEAKPASAAAAMRFMDFPPDPKGSTSIRPLRWKRRRSAAADAFDHAAEAEAVGAGLARAQLAHAVAG